MKNIFLVMILAAFSMNLLSQECDFTINETDKFTGSVVKVLNSIEVAKKVESGKSLKFKDIIIIPEQNGVKFYLSIDWRYSKGYVVMNGVAGSSVLLLLENLEQVELKMATMMHGTVKHGSKIYQSNKFIISPDDFVKLSYSKLTDIRVKAFTNPFDFQLDPEAQEELMKSIKCFEPIIIEKEKEKKKATKKA